MEISYGETLVNSALGIGRTVNICQVSECPGDGVCFEHWLQAFTHAVVLKSWDHTLRY